MNNKLISDIMQSMIAHAEGNRHDIAHFMKVYAYAHTIGIAEGLSDTEQETLEIAAILHDIACPLCRLKYGNTDGKHQEEESAPLVKAFLKDFDVPEAMKERIVYLVCHHHTYVDVDGLDYRILLEADFFVNADEHDMPIEAIEKAREQIFRTATGTALLDCIYFS